MSKDEIKMKKRLLCVDVSVVFSCSGGYLLLTIFKGRMFLNILTTLNSRKAVEEKRQILMSGFGVSCSDSKSNSLFNVSLDSNPS